ncbi:hypothetical protein RIF29_24517 [Crotalaria pallida]|uniref:Uncharacterized protein n=1 Tax=Crotalaria pallida TaxID=3830 RepID=A0AAN9I3C5_CROPI
MQRDWLALLHSWLSFYNPYILRKHNNKSPLLPSQVLSKLSLLTTGLSEGITELYGPLQQTHKPLHERFLTPEISQEISASLFQGHEGEIDHGVT